MENRSSVNAISNKRLNRSNYEDKLLCLEKIIDNLDDGVLLTDKNGKIIIYNRAMEELEKRKASDMVGKFIWEAYEYFDKNKSEHMRVLKSGSPITKRYKAHAYNEDGPVYKLYSTFPIEIDGEIIGVYSISKNETRLQFLLSEITEMKNEFFRQRILKSDDINPNGTKFTFSDIIGSSNVMKKLIQEAQSVAWIDNNILLVGDTGTGKEVFAQSIHNYGNRNSEPFIGVNCASIPENLLESTLFGTVRGAYTGALDSPGLIEQAGSGTLFLDEIHNMPVNMQAKLLRVLQERIVRRIGGSQNYPVKCRIISAINEDPFQLIENGQLRQDLYYRLAGYCLYIPPLIERENDIFELSEYFIKKSNLIMGKNVIYMTDRLKEIMKNYSWPGNVRELEHFIASIMIRTNVNDKYLRAKNAPKYLINMMKANCGNYYEIQSGSNLTLQEKLDSIEKKMILEALDSNLWNVTKTAKELGVTRQSLIYRMRKLGIKRKENRD
ncbi:sigma-54 interaction domain-containing protein [Tepidimicrobium xylanilyticum]|uniref:Arginine utilization regulatory protein n=1 Tax=Tepidimicrobium xylanilyticum TaxID=1123352 RepID=A0A1H3E4H2_9FIRM|nr:sigma 54-interacting transcriptional regulator [Tepidimicrobium xylanilyticum]SDX72824.1 arginine utilization regulatory protein [Tepidimicrobium xylanilyticum]